MPVNPQLLSALLRARGAAGGSPPSVNPALLKGAPEQQPPDFIGMVKEMPLEQLTSLSKFIKAEMGAKQAAQEYTNGPPPEEGEGPAAGAQATPASSPMIQPPNLSQAMDGQGQLSKLLPLILMLLRSGKLNQMGGLPGGISGELGAGPGAPPPEGGV